MHRTETQKKEETKPPAKNLKSGQREGKENEPIAIFYPALGKKPNVKRKDGVKILAFGDEVF